MPSKENPADLLSRGTNVDILCNSKLWNSGPEFLHVAEIPPQIYETSLEQDPEIKTNVNKCNTDKLEETPLDKLMNSKSSYYKLKVKIAWYSRLKSCC